ncbi:uncharacterized protein [Gossypium hirsutum]|uniref:Reverse transcriptase n=1 Tax=Gossypium hirsutum TaxID=3635 RepID=A0ABM3AZJ7_GOSHI|nr:uncharacterized protein LOC121223179 [Gossypium hirsutum]
MSQFRPISLCNVLYKILAKVIANRLRLVIEKCIDEAQSAFVPRRLISDNVLLAYEGVDKIGAQNRTDRGELKLVSDLINLTSRKWRRDVINSTFQEEIARKILQTPLAEFEHEDFQVWKGELSGEFSVRSAYKLLQDANQIPNDYLLQTELKEFYKKLWSLQLPSKITFTIWRISWDFIPNFANLRYRRVTVNDRCPRCCSAVEESVHVFRECPLTIEVWQQLNLSRVMNYANQNMGMAYLGLQGKRQRNQLVHQRRNTTGRDLAHNIQRHLAEFEGLKNLKNSESINRSHKTQEGIPSTRIYFDAAFDSRTFSSATGLVGWDLRGNLMALKTVIHRDVPSPFAAEAYACLEGAKLGSSIRIKSVRLMGDSKSVIKKCQATSTDESVIGAIISDIQKKKADFQEVIF